MQYTLVNFNHVPSSHTIHSFPKLAEGKDENTAVFQGGASLEMNDGVYRECNFITFDDVEVFKVKADTIIQWVLSNHSLLTSYLVEQGVYDDWCKEEDYTKEKFKEALRIVEISINPDYSFMVGFCPDEEEELFEIMGDGHGPTIEIAQDYALQNVGFNG